jgi:hypothetical protein
MRQLPADAVVYYEDAAFHEPAFVARVGGVIAALSRKKATSWT